jgi:hypothetical protein
LSCTSATSPRTAREAPTTFGAKRCGIVSLELAAGSPARHEFIEPEGLAQLTLTSDLPDPYHP